ncbi:two-component sensor histidine kinase [Lipingzhangella halophila]|uniref:Two-component sensor histidine kinase n=1 Tax=Lipingzhangella halophila TaxID=1783352 RepID=A0A7W7W0N8_9ACTN|nr:two-component sensor histidine kinase [Lipingzhangella halophila]
MAREIARGILREWGMTRFAADVELVVSELVTNALRHGPDPGASGGDCLLQLTMMRRGGELVCAVRDANDRIPVRREPDFMLETGRGLRLVSCFAASWGAVPTVPVGKFVWALFR